MTPSPLLVLASTVLLLQVLRLFVLAYLARRERAAYLRLWALGFLVQLGVQLAVLPGLLGRPVPALEALSLAGTFAMAVLLLDGTWRMLGRRFARGRWWLGAAVGFVAVGALHAAGAPFRVALGAAMVLPIVAYARMGLALFSRRRELSGLGVGLTLAGLAATGLHFADFPFLADQAWFIPWGIGLACFNDLLLAMGLVVLHFDRSHAEQKLVEARYAEMADTIGVGTYEAAANGRFVEVNGALARMLGYASAAEVLALDLSGDLGVVPGDGGEALAGREATWRRRDGLPVVVQLHGRALRDAEGRVTGYRGFVVDRTEARRLEDTVRRTQKLDAIGHLAGGVAHDFNNLLTVIRTSLELLSFQPASAQALGDALEATDQAAQLTRRLLAFGRKQPTRAEPVDVGASALRTAELLARSFGERHRLDTRGVTSGAWALLDAGQLEQVLVNLLLNARDASAHGGVIEVGVRRLERAGQPGVELWVKDEGAGMEPALKARVFEPFFTTKEPGRGTGLGLSTVHGVVAQAGGAVDVESEVGRGSRFSVWFPAVTAPAPGANAASATAAPAAKRVLVVDDEPGIRRTLCRMLQGAGYRTLEAPSGHQALALLAGGERVDVLLSDVRMPDGDGPATAWQARVLVPGLRVVLMSGFHELPEGGAQASADAFLAKPFTREALLEAIEGRAGTPVAAPGRPVAG